MKKLVILSLLAMLSGCISSVSLIAQEGQRYIINVDQVARKLTTNIDGVFYSGTAVADESVGFAVGQTYGLKPTFGTSSMITQGSGARAMLVSADGDVIRCEYTKNGLRIIGQCQSNKGRQFALMTE